MKTTRLLMLVCALFLCASVAKAEYVAMHKISVESELSTFDSDTNVFSITIESERTFSFNVGYQFLNPELEAYGPLNTGFRMDIGFNGDIFNVKIGDYYKTDLLNGIEPRLNLTNPTDSRVYVSWNNANGNWYRNYDNTGYLIGLTFELKDGVSFEELFSTAITFSFRNANDVPFDTLPTITFMRGQEAVPEPGTLAILSLGLASLPFVKKRLRKTDCC